MRLPFVLPVIAALACAAVAAPLQRRARPSIAVPALAVLTVLAAIAGVSVVGGVALGWLVQIPTIEDWLGWCRYLYGHQAIPWWAGAPASALLVLMAVRVGSCVARRYRAVHAPRLQSGDLEVLPVDDPIAFAVPGRPGHVVVSIGMLRLLDARERSVLLAHERSHLERGHHHFIAVSEVAAASVPVLRPLADHVRFATERWADEDAAVAVGDRELVARTIARAALAGAREPSLALAGLGVAARVEALLAPPPRRALHEMFLLAGTGVTLSSLLGSGVQLHHVLALAAHVCRI